MKVLIWDLMFMDDTAFVAHSHEDVQDIITHFAGSAKPFGLKINIKKPEKVYQPAPGSTTTGQPIKIQDQELCNVRQFKYLGSTVMNNNRIDEDIITRMANASISYGRLNHKVW